MTEKRIAEIVEELPEPHKIRLTQNGFNVHFLGKVYCFFYSQKRPAQGKMVVNGNTFVFWVGDEAEVFRTVCGDIPEDNEPPERIHTVTEVNKGTGTQACIDHLIAKKELVLNSKRTDNTRLVNMLTILIDELKQFL